LNYYCWSEYHDYELYYEADCVSEYYWLDADQVDYIHLYYTCGDDYSAEKDGEYYSEKYGVDPLVDMTYIYYDDGYYNQVCDNVAGECTAYYDDYYELVEGPPCDGSYYEDADKYYSYTYLKCENDDDWSEYYVVTGDYTEYYYYAETWDTWYHTTCYDSSQQACEYQYDDIYDAGTMYYEGGDVYYWEIYSLPDQETYNGKHVHVSADGDYTIYIFSEPEGQGTTYHETDTFASQYDYATGAYTEWLQDFYGDFESDLFGWDAITYMGDDSDRVDDFTATMEDDNVHLLAYYNEADDLIVSVTTTGGEFYAVYTVGDEANAILQYGDDGDKETWTDEYGAYHETSWYTTFDGDYISVTMTVDIYGMISTYYSAIFDGEPYAEYYAWYDNLSEDHWYSETLGIDLYNSYENSYYYENGAYGAYYLLADDGSYSYYLDTMTADDGTYRSTEGIDGAKVTYYASADGYFEAYYDWSYHTYYTVYNDYYLNVIADDGLSGYYVYTSPSQEYYIQGYWSQTDDGEFYSIWEDSYGESGESYQDGDFW